MNSHEDATGRLRRANDPAPLLPLLLPPDEDDEEGTASTSAERRRGAKASTRGRGITEAVVRMLELALPPPPPPLTALPIAEREPLRPRWRDAASAPDHAHPGVAEEASQDASNWAAGSRKGAGELRRLSLNI